MNTSTADLAPPPAGPFYRHLVATTVVQCLVVIAALALDAVALWAAGVVLVTALALAAHAAHLRRATHRPGPGPRIEEAGR